MKHAFKVIALAMALLVMLVGCGEDSAPAAGISPVEAIALEDGQSGHVFWSFSGYRDVVLQSEFQSIQAWGEEEKAQLLMDTLNSLSLDSSTREDTVCPQGNADVFLVSYNTAEDPENKILYLIIADGRLYFFEDLNGFGYSYAITGSAALITETIWEMGRSLDYQLDVYVPEVRPDSEAFRIVFTCRGAEPVELTAVAINGTAAMDLSPFTITEESTQLTLSMGLLPRIENGLTYELQLTLVQGGETVPVTSELNISNEGWLFQMPMSPDNQELFDQYVVPFSAALLYDTPFGPSQPLVDFHPYTLFFSSYYAEYGRGVILGHYPDGWLPGDVVEELVSKYYPITAEEFRASVPEITDGEGYDPIGIRYRFSEGLGGAYPYYVVTGSRQEGNLLHIDCTLYDATTGAAMYPCVLTVNIEDGSYYQYTTGEM